MATLGYGQGDTGATPSAARGMTGATEKWISAVPTVGRVELPPEARSMESLGRHHALPSPIAASVRRVGDE